MHSGSCHCGKVAFEVEPDMTKVIECNCSHCSRKGYLLAFAPRASLRITKGEGELSTYTFNKHVIKHHFCPTCGCAPFGMGRNPKTGEDTVAVNIRCLEGVDPSKQTIIQVDGRSF